MNHYVAIPANPVGSMALCVCSDSIPILIGVWVGLIATIAVLVGVLCAYKELRSLSVNERVVLLCGLSGSIGLFKTQSQSQFHAQCNARAALQIPVALFWLHFPMKANSSAAPKDATWPVSLPHALPLLLPLSYTRFCAHV